MIWYLMVHHLVTTVPGIPPVPVWTRLGPYTYDHCNELSIHYDALQVANVLEQPYCDMEPIND